MQDKITDAPEPTNVHELRAFLGVIAMPQAIMGWGLCEFEIFPIVRWTGGKIRRLQNLPMLWLKSRGHINKG